MAVDPQVALYASGAFMLAAMAFAGLAWVAMNFATKSVNRAQELERLIHAHLQDAWQRDQTSAGLKYEIPEPSVAEQGTPGHPFVAGRGTP